MARVIAFVLGIALLVFIVAWPWMLGTYIATSRGWAKHTIEYDVTGWLPESIYLLGGLAE